MSMTRREALIGGAGLAAGGAALLARGTANAQAHEHGGAAPVTPPAPPPGPVAPPVVDGERASVIVPNGSTLPWRRVGGAKVFHLVAEPVRWEMAPGLVVDGWGYNGQSPGPLLEAVEGDRVRIYVTNRLPEPTTVHWHGMIVPNGMDGVAGLTQPSIAPGETFRYEFTLRTAGTFMYHPHFDEMTQIALGMTGMFVVHPRARRGPRVDRDFALMLLEWFIAPGSSRPNPLHMNDFNLLTMNSRAFPGTAPLLVARGERVRIRLGNLGPMDHHPIHLHGYSFKVTATDGGPIPESAQWPETTVLVPVGSTRDIEFVADNPGDWALHCHMTHHTMNQMGHDAPNMVGVPPGALDRRVRPLLPGYMTMGSSGMGDMSEMRMATPRNSIPMLGGAGPFGTIDMGGMFTIVKVHERVDAQSAAGWYRHPEGTVARAATPDELRADGIEPRGSDS